MTHRSLTRWRKIWKSFSRQIQSRPWRRSQNWWTVWLRFVLAVFFGVWIGKQGGGGSSILAILNFITFPPIFYCRTFLAADADSYGSKLYFSGVVQGLALATLIWVYFFTDSHTQDEAALASVLDNVVADQEVVTSNIGDDATMDVDSEFWVVCCSDNKILLSSAWCFYYLGVGQED